MADHGVIFQGSVITGRGLTYSTETKLPVSGVVDCIQVQTRSEDQVLETHCTLPNIALCVQTLNTTYANAPTPWFDASGMFEQSNVLDKNGNLELTTGDVLTAKELKAIATAKDAEPAINTAPDLDGLDDIVVMMNITQNDIPQTTDLPNLSSCGFGNLYTSAAG
ncbi:hypothetical protein N9O61_03115 [Octadecabacter sp.]|nr:hypothetical protein [Octadecabacter sp.]